MDRTFLPIIPLVLPQTLLRGGCREDILFPALMVGGKGCITATAGILPEIMVGIYNAWREGNYEKARDLQFSILLLVGALFAAPFPIGFKTAFEVRGFKMEPPSVAPLRCGAL